MFGFIFCGLLAAFVYLYYVPLPSNAREPMRQRLLIFIFTLTRDFNYIKHLLGFGSEVVLMKSINPPLVVDPNDTVESKDEQFDGVSVRIFRQKGDNDTRPGVLYLHGGGWCIGTIDGHDSLARQIVREKKMVLVLVGYRLSPEYPYPTPLNDCYVAAKHFLLNAKDYGVDPERIAIMGDSAGGNLSCAVSLKLQEEEHAPSFKLQVLVYPALQAIDFLLPSYTESRDRRKTPGVLDSKLMVEFWVNYALGFQHTNTLVRDLMNNRHLVCGFKQSDSNALITRELLPQGLLNSSKTSVSKVTYNESLLTKIANVFLDPLFSPLMASDESLRKLPNTYLITCDMDPLRDEGLMFAQRMTSLKQDFTHRHWDGTFHGFFTMPSLFQTSKTAIQEVVSYLDKYF